MEKSELTPERALSMTEAEIQELWVPGHQPIIAFKGYVEWLQLAVTDGRYPTIEKSFEAAIAATTEEHLPYYIMAYRAIKEAEKK